MSMKPLRILLPTDFSVQSDYAWILAEKLAEKLPIEPHFLHVLQVPASASFTPDGELIRDGEWDPAIYQRLKAAAENRLHLLAQQHPEAQVHLTRGALTDAIVAHATEHPFDLVLMGTKGSFGLQEKLSGSETQHVARLCPVPVLSLMCDRSELQIRNLLLAGTFNDEHPRNLHVLKALQQAFGATLHLLCVVPKPIPGDIEAARVRMELFALDNGLHNTQLHVVTDHDLEHGVTHFVQMHEVDLVAIGLHPRTGLSALLRETVAEKLVNHLFKPLLTFHLR